MHTNHLIDLPLSGTEDAEPLGLHKYADALADFIGTCETPVTIGVQGDWGIGKTSLLNRIKYQLERPKRGRGLSHPVLFFNTWQYAQLSSEDLITVAMLNDIVNVINEEFKLKSEQGKKALKAIGSFTSHLVNQAMKSKTGLDVKGAVEDARKGLKESLEFTNTMRMLVKYRGYFEQLVAEALQEENPNVRLVIMLDDLDRIRPARALELLEAVKNFLDVPRCVFVLAVDYSVIQRGVEERLGTDVQRMYGKSYFDKIIQVPFNMPISSYKVERYIMSLLGWTYHGETYRRIGESNSNFIWQLSRVEVEQAKEFETLTLVTVGKNPRSIKRAVNYANLLKNIFDASDEGQRILKQRRGEYGPSTWIRYSQLLYAMACFQLTYPEVFGFFVQHPTPTTFQQMESREFIRSLPDIDKLFARVYDVEQTLTNITGFFDQVLYLLDGFGKGEDIEADGRLDTTEFQPVWDVLNIAGLTNIELEHDMWTAVHDLAQTYNNKRSNPRSNIEKQIHLLQQSSWNNPYHLRLIKAGTRFFTVLWDNEEVGSIASTQQQPLQFYLEVDDAELFIEGLSKEALTFVQDATLVSHYGIGNINVNLEALVSTTNKDARKVMNELLRALRLASQEKGEIRTSEMT